MGNNKLFTEEELLEIKQDNQHDELLDALKLVLEASKDDSKFKAISQAIQGNATQLAKFVEAFKSIKFDLPQVTVGAPQVNVDVKQEEVVRAIGAMFREMKEFLIEVRDSTEQLSHDVQELNLTNRADRIMRVKWDYGRVEQITVSVKK